MFVVCDTEIKFYAICGILLIFTRKRKRLSVICNSREKIFIEFCFIKVLNLGINWDETADYFFTGMFH